MPFLKNHTMLFIWLKKQIFYTITIYFQPENTRSLCQTVLKVVYDLRLVLFKFAECHQMFHGKIEYDDEKVEGFSKI